jgi:glycosyltransferase involved in cell wall biosynthesis
MNNQSRLKLLTWHVHSNYLYYLSRLPYDWVIPVTETEGSLGNQFDWGDRVQEVPIEDLCYQDFDGIVFQGRSSYATDQYEWLTPAQRELPRVYIEHDPPREHPTDTTHWVNDGKTVIVQVTNFNQLMWHTGEQPTRVIEHGVKIPELVEYKGGLNKGLVVINNLDLRGRRLGLDIFEAVRKEVPLDLVGIGSERLGGLGEMPPKELIRMMAQYRFLFSPIRYTSLGLSIIEAMMVGLPVVGLATTELADVITTGSEGLVSTKVETLVEAMRYLLAKPEVAMELSNQARATAEKRFSITRFGDDWETLFEDLGLRQTRPETQMEKRWGGFL